MKLKSWRGSWWLPDTPHDSSPGQLIVEDDGRCRLEIVGSLDLERAAAEQPPEWQSGVTSDRVAVIHGIARGKPITLLECFTSSSDGFSAASRSYQDIHVHEALVGAHITYDEAAFESAIVEIENLTSWLAYPDLVHRARDGDDERATYRRPPDLSCMVDGWTIMARGLTQPFNATHKRSRLSVEGEVSTYLLLTPPEPRPARDFHSLIHELTDLITLAANEASGQIQLTLIHRVPTAMPQQDGTSIELSTRVESFGARIHTAGPDSPATADWRFLFTCRDRPMEDLVPEWLRIRRRAPEACNVYFGLRYTRPTYTEIRLLLMAITTEALHKALVNQTALSDNDIEELRAPAGDGARAESMITEKLRRTPTFRERAIELAAKPDARAVSRITPDVGEWAVRLKDARNNLAHTGNETSDDDIFQLEWVTSSIIALALMAELGLSPDVQQRAARDILSPPR
ncbi:HEPN domain-containing protein [Mycetocola sp.]|uniref:ApeA N-terminal domain 1-containing protein n=1 Tax=Mycetocola sp. TaxID=1871042 RepID=UPI003988BDDF